MSTPKMDSLKPIVALCKRRGFIYPGSEIYGGFANTYTMGPYGVELKKNVTNLWWKTFVHNRRDIVGIDGPILLHPKTWEASGHLKGFNDALIDCRSCKSRYRVDHLLENKLHLDVEGLDLAALTDLVRNNQIACPKCGKKEFTDARYFNLMFSVEMNKTSENVSKAFLRPETAQAIFLEFLNIVNTMRVKIPFGVAQIGKAFRNEITPGNFIFRLIEFEQMEIEYFIRENEWKEVFESWLATMKEWCKTIGLNPSKIHEKEHSKEKLSHYSKRTVDLTYDFPFGREELYGLAYRTNHDLSKHQEFSGVKQEYVDLETNEHFIPHVIEPTFGVERTLLALLCDAYDEETLSDGEKRTVLHFSPRVAPVKAAVFPLMKKEDLVEKAKQVHQQLYSLWNIDYDDSGAIGKRYRRHDELGTPFCFTIDYDTLQDNTVTLRDRDSMQQKRVKIEAIPHLLFDLLK